mmetsp:Transcript_14096/g.41342  ORF Transcript_14096/g.41342 Transcript_14096/m.41342 type:complete len:375 (-) Transcript_14096:363-1487(-)
MPSDDELYDEDEKGRGCCGNEDDDDEGCCDEDCCNRTCCGGRITCSLEAGFAATFAVLSMGAMLFANNSCWYVELQGINKTADDTDVSVAEVSVAVMERGIFYGDPWSNATCVSWISLQNSIVSLGGERFIDPWWWASMGCAVAASAFGFAALVQVAFLSCVPRASQRFAARCASGVSTFAAVLEGLTLLFLKSTAASDDTEWYYHDNISMTESSLHISAWCAISSCAGWFITAFILCFVKNPLPDDFDRVVSSAAETSSHKESSHRGSERRASTELVDEEEGEAEAAENMREVPVSPAVAVAVGAGAAAAAFRHAESSTSAERFEDALTGSIPTAEAPFSSEHGSNGAGLGEHAGPAWDSYGKSAGEDDFIDG